ncbi:MAG: hypothetical protein V4692_01015 [Bdellovibrionota bacterium]
MRASLLVFAAIALFTSTSYSWEQKIHGPADEAFAFDLCREAMEPLSSKNPRAILPSLTAKEAADRKVCATTYNLPGEGRFPVGKLLCGSVPKLPEQKRDCLVELIMNVSDKDESEQEGPYSFLLQAAFKKCRTLAAAQAQVDCLLPKLNFKVKPQESWQKAPAAVAPYEAPEARRKGTRLPGARQMPTVDIPPPRRQGTTR